MPFFECSDGARIFYVISGQGTPVLLLHGFMGTGASEFITVRPWLEKKYTVIAPDLRGYGRSTPKPRLYGRDFYRHDAEDMAALLEHLNLSPAAVVGYSDGGEVALWLPILAPQRVRSVLTWGAVGHFDSMIRPAVLSMLTQRWRTPLIDQLHGAEHIEEMTHRWVSAVLQMIDSGGDVTFSRAKEILCPVLLMLGDRDDLNPAELGRSMAAALPKGRLSLYRRTGHAIHSERPHSFRREVSRFLNRTRG